MIKWIITIFLAAVIAVISRASILKPRSHGFWRFFSWESILVLIAINLEAWFIDPFSSGTRLLPGYYCSLRLCRYILASALYLHRVNQSQIVRVNPN